MKRFILAGAGIAALFAGPASAQPGPEGPPPLRRADVEQQLKDQFARLDANHDGILTRDEANADPGRGAAGGGRGSDELFDRLDTNHDGALSREEFAGLRAMFRGGGGGGSFSFGLGGGNWFDRVDANKDSKVTLDEMRTVVLALFDRVDANHDGVVTPDERQAVMRSMRPRGDAPPPPDGQ